MLSKLWHTWFKLWQGSRLWSNWLHMQSFLSVYELNFTWSHSCKCMMIIIIGVPTNAETVYSIPATKGSKVNLTSENWAVAGTWGGLSSRSLQPPMHAEQECCHTRMLFHSLILFCVFVSCALVWFLCMRVLRLIKRQTRVQHVIHVYVTT